MLSIEGEEYIAEGFSTIKVVSKLQLLSSKIFRLYEPESKLDNEKSLGSTKEGFELIQEGTKEPVPPEGITDISPSKL